jgi:hypothetical protein
MAKLDLYKQHHLDYVTPRNPVIVDIKPTRYLTITGRGEPGGESFQTRLGALYNVAFTIKMARKFAGHRTMPSASSKASGGETRSEELFWMNHDTTGIGDC